MRNKIILANPPPRPITCKDIPPGGLFQFGVPIDATNIYMRTNAFCGIDEVHCVHLNSGSLYQICVNKEVVPYTGELRIITGV